MNQKQLLTIDGSHGEGGGQILRTSLALSVCLKQPLEIINIRANRPKPGLRPQHLACVNAAAAISSARVEGAAVNSDHLRFEPETLTAGDYHFEIGTAGSTTLVLQTVLPPLMQADARSVVTVTGGTHNPMAPPFEFLAGAFLPVLHEMGADIELAVKRLGFAPQGMGELVAHITPVEKLHPWSVVERGKFHTHHTRILLANLPKHIAVREAGIIAEAFDLTAADVETVVDNDTSSTGNMIAHSVHSENITEVFTSLGRKKLPAERVARNIVRQVREYLESPAPVSEHLADQLMLPIALAGSGSFVTGPLSLHSTTNMEVIAKFTGEHFVVEEAGPDLWHVSLN